MEVVQNRVENRKSTMSILQMMFMVVKGLGNLAAMVGVVYLFTAIVNGAVIGAELSTFTGVLAGIFMIIGGQQLVKLGDQLEERYMLKSEHLELPIQKSLTRVLVIAMIAGMLTLI